MGSHAGGAAGIAAALALSGVAGAAQSSFDFEVLLDGKAIGGHRFDVETAPDGSRTVRSQASFDVRVLGVRLYRYRHEAQETWREGCVQAITATTDDNGDKVQLRGAQEGDSFRVVEPQQGGARPGCISAFAYWDEQGLLRQRELLNPQTGFFQAVRFESLGEESIQSRGTTLRARRHRLIGEDLRIDLWYSLDGEWLQLESPARGSRKLLYRLRD